MTQLELAFSEIEKLPPAEQKEFAAWILEELHSEQRWVKLFAESSDVLSSLADEALLTEHKENCMTTYKILEARPLDDYKISLKFDDGAAGEVDLSHLAGKGVFEF